jgi:hypothetical protein
MKDDLPSEPLRLKLCSYSEQRKLKDIIRCLEKCPDQMCNTLQAAEGLVMEFSHNGIPGSLSEWFNAGRNKGNKRVIICADDGEVLVCRNNYSQWIPEYDSKGLSLLDKHW